MNLEKLAMDAKEFFQIIVIENYKEVIADPTNFRKRWNAAVSMNTVPEYLALDRAGYSALTSGEVDKKVEAVRNEIPGLPELKSYADRLKHVRKHERGEVTGSSTSMLPQDPSTWADLSDLVDRTYTTFSNMPELK
jgi:hypothetical protein